MWCKIKAALQAVNASLASRASSDCHWIMLLDSDAFVREQHRSFIHMIGLANPRRNQQPQPQLQPLKQPQSQQPPRDRGKRGGRGKGVGRGWSRGLVSGLGRRLLGIEESMQEGMQKAMEEVDFVIAREEPPAGAPMANPRPVAGLPDYLLLATG